MSGYANVLVWGGLLGPWTVVTQKWAESAHTPFEPSDTKCQELFCLLTGETQTADDHGADSPRGKLASDYTWLTWGPRGLIAKSWQEQTLTVDWNVMYQVVDTDVQMGWLASEWRHSIPNTNTHEAMVMGHFTKKEDTCNFAV